MAAQVCIYGKDRGLAEIRAEVLRKAGFEASVDCTVHKEQDLSGTNKVAVLCNSLDKEEQIHLAKALKADTPGKKVVILLPLGGGGSYPAEIGKVIEASPVGMVAAVTELIG